MNNILIHDDFNIFFLCYLNSKVMVLEICHVSPKSRYCEKYFLISYGVVVTLWMN